MESITFPKLPNPTTSSDPNWTQFNDYLARNRIKPVKHPALSAYQHAAEGRFLGAHDLNHCLTLKGAGTSYASYKSGRYSAEERLGSLEHFSDPNGPDFECSKNELDRLFETSGVHFDATSVVYKGIGHDEFYEYLDLAAATTGDVIQFHGYMSTSICRENAEQFAASGVLLILSRIDRVRTLVPPNEPVINGPNGSTPEHEILLNRQHLFTVQSISIEPAHFPGGRPLRILNLEANP